MKTVMKNRSNCDQNTFPLDNCSLGCQLPIADVSLENATSETT